MLEFEPRPLMDDFAADPRGTLFAVAHSGNFDLCGLHFIHDYGRPLAVVMKPLGTPRFNDALIDARKSYGFEVIRTDTGNVVERCAERLSAGGLVCVLPELLISYASVPFYFGGTSLLIAVSVTMDTVAQVQGHLLAHQYEGLIKKAKLRGATRR